MAKITGINLVVNKMVGHELSIKLLNFLCQNLGALVALEKEFISAFRLYHA